MEMAVDLTKANLNRHYREYYPSLMGGFINRTEFAQYEEYISNGESVIIHGKAGSGKSGCAKHISSFCENSNIPYIAIRLDEKTLKKPE